MERNGADVIISRAKSCIETAQENYRIIAASEVQNTAAVARVDRELQRLKEDGQYLLGFSQRQEIELQKKEKEYKKEVEALSKERGKVETEKQKSMSQKSSLEAQQSSLRSTRDTHQRALNDAQSSLSNAEARLRDAQDKLTRAKGERGSTQAKGMGTGAALGLLFLGPVGAFIGAATGAAVGTAISDEEVKDAESVANSCSSRVSNAKTDLANADSALHGVNDQIRSYQESIKECEAKIRVCDGKSKNLHDKISNIKGSLAFVKKAIYVWGNFGNMSHDATERTSHLKMIIQIASETNEYNLVTSDGTKIAAKSFLEAWEKFARQETLLVITTDDTQTIPQALQ